MTQTAVQSTNCTYSLISIAE